VKQYGYNGKILRIDLTHQKVDIQEMEENWYRIYGGGALMGAYFLLKETPAKLDAFNPDNLLIFASSIIAGQDGPGLAKFSVVTKSPLSQGIGEARCEGPWGQFLKGSGYDAIVVTGKSKEPVVLVVEDGQVTIENASDLWGKNTHDTTQALEAKHGADKVRNYKILGNLWSACDALGLCIFASAPTRLLSLQKITNLINSITGWHTSSYEFIRWGERRNHLMRIYNLREGITSEQDTLPERFFKEPIQNGRLKDVVIDKKEFQESIDTYYEMMGWDEKGVPRKGTLYDHHLEWVRQL